MVPRVWSKNYRTTNTIVRMVAEAQRCWPTAPGTCWNGIAMIYKAPPSFTLLTIHNAAPISQDLACAISLPASNCVTRLAYMICATAFTLLTSVASSSLTQSDFLGETIYIG